MFQLYSTVTLRLGEKKHYNNKVDAYSFAIVLWELLHNKLPFEGMSNLQAAYAAAFKVCPTSLFLLVLASLLLLLFWHISFLQNVRPSAESLPEDLGVIVTSCWNEDPNARPNFTQIIQLLLNYLSKVGSPALSAIPQRILASKNSLLPPDSPGTSSLMATKLDECGETPKTKTEDKRKGLFFCFNQCY